MRNLEVDSLSKSQWKGYNRYDFYLNGREAILIEPEEAAAGRPWIWRAEFFDAFAQVDMAMLSKGWHLAYFKMSDMYGCPEAVALMHEFHDCLMNNFSLKLKTVLLGFSRGGLYAFNYTETYTEKVGAIYLDAPVLDIKSWPAGKGKGVGAPEQWKECREIYNIKDEDLESFKGSPIDKINKVAEAKIPIIMIAGDADEVVPYEENGAILAKKYLELGGTIEVIMKPGIGHHPHSLENPKPVVDFLLRNNI
jgi:pimeloyl-ACP methyl ester carboxylesterase